MSVCTKVSNHLCWAFKNSRQGRRIILPPAVGSAVQRWPAGYSAEEGANNLFDQA